jgi:hypothetical protein
MNCKCGNAIPDKRVEFLKKNQKKISCIDCSTEQRVSCYPVLNHKTGNAIELCDQETADRLKVIMNRKGGIVSQGMRGIGLKDKKYNIHKSA